MLVEGERPKVDGVDQRIELHDDELRSAMERFFDVLVLVDERAMVLHITAEVEQLLGYLPAYVVGKSAFSFLDEHDQHRTALELMREMENEHNRSETFTVRFRHADGSWRDVEVAGVNRFTSLGGLVVGMRDVSTRRVSDRVLRQLSLGRSSESARLTFIRSPLHDPRAAQQVGE